MHFNYLVHQSDLLLGEVALPEVLEIGRDLVSSLIDLSTSNFDLLEDGGIRRVLVLLEKIFGDVAWSLILRSLLRLLAGIVGDVSWRRLPGSTGMSYSSVKTNGVLLEVSDVVLHLGDELPVGALDILDGSDMVPIEVVECHSWD